MRVVRTSLISLKTRTRDLPITQKQINSWKNGAHIQDAFPNLSADDREFIMTGITPDEWDELFGEEE